MNSNYLNLNEVSHSFVKFFDNRDFSNIEIASKIFGNIETDQWWMSGDEQVYPFSGWKSIQKRLYDMVPLICGYDKFSFIEMDKVIDHERRIIMLEAKTVAVGYGNEYTNEYTFKLSVDENGKISSIKEYFDPSEVLKFALTNQKLQELYNKV